MNIVHKEQAKKFSTNNKFLALEYPMKDKDINGSVIKLSGRYPDNGYVFNTICKEMIYVISGKGKIVLGDKETEVIAGDLILINPKEKYYWEGELEMFVPSVPAWYPEQQKVILDASH